MKARKLTHDEANARALEVADMIMDGKTLTQVTDHYSYSTISAVRNLIENNLLYLDKEKYDAVKAVLHNNNVECCRKIGQKNKGPKPETLKKARDVADYMIKTNCTYATAERHFGMSQNSASPLIHRILKEHDSTKYLELMNAIERRKNPVGSFVAPKLPEDIELKFDKASGYTEHNIRALCNYIIKNNTPYFEAAEHFGVTQVYLRNTLARCRRKFDNLYDLIEKATNAALKGHYEGEMYDNYDRLCGKNIELDEFIRMRNEITIANGYRVSEYLLVNTAGWSDAGHFFNVSAHRCKEAVLALKEIDYKKFKEVHDMLAKYHSKAPKSSVEEQSSNNVVQMIVPDTAPLSSPTLVSEPVKVAASAEPIVKDTDVPVIEKVCETKIEMVAKPAVEDVKVPKIGIFQKIKNWFMGA